MTKTNSSTMSFKSKWMQPLIGITIITVFLVALASYQFGSGNKTATNVFGMAVAGIFLGYVLSRGRFGFAGPVKKLVQQGDGRQAKALIYLFMITSVIAGAGMIGMGMGAFTPYPIVMRIGWGLIIGGVIFGIGMVLATGCASGTLTDAGDGNVPAMLVLVFFMIGSVFGVASYGTAFDKATFIKQGTDNSLATLTGSVWIGVIINLGLLGLLLGIVVIVHKWRASKGTQTLTKLPKDYQIFGDAEISNRSWKEVFTYNTFQKMFAKRFSWMVAIIGVAIWFAVIVLAFHETAGITGAYAKWGIYLTHGFGIHDSLNWGGYTNWDINNDTQSWQNFGIIIGALSAKLFANDFKLFNYRGLKWHNWALFALGGLLMGLGARLARGCNFGALFTGVSFGTGFGWIFAITLFTGTIGTSFVIKKIRHNTPAEAYKK